MVGLRVGVGVGVGAGVALGVATGVGLGVLDGATMTDGSEDAHAVSATEHNLSVKARGIVSRRAQAFLSPRTAAREERVRTIRASTSSTDRTSRPTRGQGA